MKARKVKGLDPDGTLADNAERIVRIRLDELASFIPRALDPTEVVALHDMRIAAKRLRYILEVTAETVLRAVRRDGAQAHEGPAGPARRDPRLRRPAPAGPRATAKLRAADARTARLRAPANAGDLPAPRDRATRGLARPRDARATSRPAASCSRFHESARRERLRAPFNAASDGSAGYRHRGQDDRAPPPPSIAGGPARPSSRRSEPFRRRPPSRSRRPDLHDPKLYDNRELSWLSFNERVLQLAEQSDEPLLERAELHVDRHARTSTSSS